MTVGRGGADQRGRDGSGRGAAKLDRIVIHKKSGISKGHCEHELTQRSAAECLTMAMELDSIRIRPSPGSAAEQIWLTDAKALFFVSTFEGDKKQQPIQFHRNTAIVNGIWVRVEFDDGEVMEGLVDNSVAHLTQKGFFLLPSDPGSNNQLVYVFKSALKEFRVLGTRPL